MRIFLSYARQDSASLDGLRDDLTEFGGPIWLDQKLAGGQPWWEEILSHLRGCTLFVLAVSHHSLASEACLAELAYANAVDRPILAIRIDDVDVVSAPAIVQRTQLIQYDGHDDASSVRALVRALRHFGPPPPLPDPLPPPPGVPMTYRQHYAAVLAPVLLPMSQQWSLLGQLKVELGVRPTRSEATELLRALRERTDIVHQVAKEIDELLAEQPGADSTAARADWYLDPAGRFELRYWDGGRWTDRVSRRGKLHRDPPTTTGAPVSRPHTGSSQGSAGQTGTLRVVRERSAAVNAVVQYGVWLDDERTAFKLRNGETTEGEVNAGTFTMTVRPVGILPGADSQAFSVPVTVTAGRTTTVRFSAGITSARHLSTDTS